MTLTSHQAIAYIAQYMARRASSETSSANSSQTTTIAAPGEGKSIVIGSVAVWYSDASAHDVTITYTDTDGTEQTATITTGSTTPEAAQTFPASGEAAVTTKENTSVTIEAPAAGSADQTSQINVVYSVIDTPLVSAVLSGSGSLL